MFPLQAWLANLVGLHISAQHCHQHPKVLWVWGHLIFNSFKNHHRFRSTEKYCWLYISGSFADDNKCWVGALLDFQKSFFCWIIKFSFWTFSENFIWGWRFWLSADRNGSKQGLFVFMSMWIVKMEKKVKVKICFEKVYLMWSNYWDQIILNGLVPITSLIYFNSRCVC